MDTPQRSGRVGYVVDEPPETRIDSVVAAFAALGHRLRLELWRMLVPHGPHGLPAGSIAARLAVAPSSLSFHLQQMTQAGILKQRRSSRRIIYAVNHAVVDDLRDFLTDQSAGSVIPPPIAVLSTERPNDIVG